MTELNGDASAVQLDVDVQYAIDDSELNEGEEPPGEFELAHWARAAYQSVADAASEVTIRLVDEPEITALNRKYRDKDQPTDVLSFAFEVGPDIDVALLGDIVICHSVAVTEARQQQKTLFDHYAHLVTHGMLHLCGYDHELQDQAQKMESLEIELLASQGIANPYQQQ
ncbi:MAG: rRNA maturation RNase YbeY [Arenicella sp.]|nr:rRNA maturation RNase YbeY [Arenicella sp.]